MQIHATADVKSSLIGDGTRIWQNVIVFEKAQIGKDCNICAFCLIENNVIIGDRVTLKSGVYVWDGLRIEDDVFIGPCVAFTNDIWPRSKQHSKEFSTTVIKRGASIGANATILPGLIIGEGAMIAAGSVVTKNVPPHTLWLGVPAKQVGELNPLTGEKK